MSGVVLLCLFLRRRCIDLQGCLVSALEKKLHAVSAQIRPQKDAAAPVSPSATSHLSSQTAYCKQPARLHYPGAGGEGLKQWEVIEVGDICVVRRLVGVKYMLTIGKHSPSWAVCLLFLSLSLSFTGWTCNLLPNDAFPRLPALRVQTALQ